MRAPHDPSVALPTVERLGSLRFDNRFTSELPGDPSDEVRPRQVHHAAWSPVAPTPTADPALLAYSRELAAQLGLDEQTISSPDAVRVFSGNALVEGMEPHAACYGGHQFGNWAGQLGDGRAIVLGEVLDVDGNRQTLQLKGAGPTPYSRSADGRAVLRSSVREFLCSEAMHHLGVPTTRALTLTTTGDRVLRDMFYDGNPEHEVGAVVCRVAPSFIRFGSFEIFAARGELTELRQLIDFTITEHFPHLLNDGAVTNDAIVDFFAEVARRTAELVVHWQRVGFVHGVMNTDNLSIHGLTIDYGPYGWLEDYDPDWTPNTTDAAGRRYRFGNQPGIAHWNLAQLANALLAITEDVEPLQAALNDYVETFHRGWNAMMAAKLGLSRLDTTAPAEVDAEGMEPTSDDELLAGLFTTLAVTETDYTIFFRGLADLPLGSDATDDERLAAVQAAFYRPDEVSGDVAETIATWLRTYAERSRLDHADAAAHDARRVAMNAVNPTYVLRNYLAQLAIDEADAGDPALISELLDVLRHPYDDQPGRERFAEKRPEWARTRPGCSMLSCSS